MTNEKTDEEKLERKDEELKNLGIDYSVANTNDLIDEIANSGWETAKAIMETVTDRRDLEIKIKAKKEEREKRDIYWRDRLREVRKKERKKIINELEKFWNFNVRTKGNDYVNYEEFTIFTKSKFEELKQKINQEQKENDN